jgi:hypothetical protein
MTPETCMCVAINSAQEQRLFAILGGYKAPKSPAIAGLAAG